MTDFERQAEQVYGVVVEAIEELREEVPNPKTRGITSTGNMAFNGLKYYRSGNEIYVYVDEKIAPYVPYTDLPWISPKWGGKKNPNEGWTERWRMALIERIAAKLNGEIQEDEDYQEETE